MAEKIHSKPSLPAGSSVGLGIALGVAFGAAFENVGFGIALGIIFGAALDAAFLAKRRGRTGAMSFVSWGLVLLAVAISLSHFGVI